MYKRQRHARSLIRIKFQDDIRRGTYNVVERSRAYPRGILPSSSFLFSIQGGSPGGGPVTLLTAQLRMQGAKLRKLQYMAPILRRWCLIPGNPVIFRTFKYVCTHARAARYTRRYTRIRISAHASYANNLRSNVGKSRGDSRNVITSWIYLTSTPGALRRRAMWYLTSVLIFYGK